MSLNEEKVLEGLARVDALLSETQESYATEMDTLLKQRLALMEWLWKHGTHTMDSVVERFIKLRDRRAAFKKTFDTIDKAETLEMDKHDVWMLQMLESMDATSMRTAHGTAFTQDKNRYSGADWPLFWKFIKDNDRFDMLEKRVGQKAVEEYREETGEIPPGLNVFSEKTVTVRRS